MAFSRVPLSRFSSVLSSNSNLIFRFSNPSPYPIRTAINITPSASSSSSHSSSFTTATPVVVENEAEEKDSSSYSQITSIPILTTAKRWWKPLCLYHTHGKCTMLDDPAHLQKFEHDVSAGLQVNVDDLQNLSAQNLDYLLVLDLEGKVEILEFPVVMIDTKTLKFVDYFHRFVRPTKMSEKRVDEYIEGKYGKFGADRVWHDTAISFEEVIQQFEIWISQHSLWERELGGALRRAAFVTCGNWDVKTKVPQQCRDSSMKLPPYFMEWINLKDVYLNFYKRRATGMMTMLKELGIPSVGSHHLGIDDTKNIVRVLQRMLSEGAQMQITAKRSSGSPENVKFLFKDRI